MTGEIKTILAEEARNHLADVLAGAEHRGEHYEIRRYRTAAAMVVPVGWYERG
jgi:antitoxin (DNA-binding transcriptional repressor) of toxin-antitoxin stability system